VPIIKNPEKASHHGVLNASSKGAFAVIIAGARSCQN